jgi:hypothetical protein
MEFYNFPQYVASAPQLGPDLPMPPFCMNKRLRDKFHLTLAYRSSCRVDSKEFCRMGCDALCHSDCWFRTA